MRITDAALADLIDDARLGTVADVLHEILDDFAAQLGESPEAWRGAITYAVYQAKVVAVSIDADADPGQQLTIATLLTSLLIDHPLAHAARTHHG